MKVLRLERTCEAHADFTHAPGLQKAGEMPTMAIRNVIQIHEVMYLEWVCAFIIHVCVPQSLRRTISAQIDVVCIFNNGIGLSCEILSIMRISL